MYTDPWHKVIKVNPALIITATLSAILTRMDIMSYLCQINLAMASLRQAAVI